MEKDKVITVIACYPGKEAQVVNLTGGLKGMQQFVGGYIEAIYPFSDPVAIIANAEGKCNGLELNRALYTERGELYDIIAGPMFICGLGEEDFVSLQDDLLEKYLEKFRHPQVFIKIGKDIAAIQVPEAKREDKQSPNKHIRR